MLIVGYIVVATLAYLIGRADGIQHGRPVNRGRSSHCPRVSELVEIQTPPLERQGLRLVGGRDCPWLDPVPGNYE